MDKGRITLGEIRELQADLTRSRLERTRECLRRRFYNAPADAIDAGARLLVAPDANGQAAVKLSEAGEITLTDSERSKAVTTLLRSCQASYSGGSATTDWEALNASLEEEQKIDARVKRLATQSPDTSHDKLRLLAEEQLANEGEVRF